MRIILIYILFLYGSVNVIAGEGEEILVRAQEHYEAGEYGEALELLRTPKLQKDSQATFLIGEVYYQQVNKQAVDFYILAAEQGHTQAMNMLGTIYDDGFVDQQADYEKAGYWWEKSIAHENYENAVELSRLYFSELEDYDKSFEFLTQMEAKDINDERLETHIHFYLGLHYRKGVGVEQNIEKAATQFRKAIDSGSIKYDALCELYSNGKFNHLDARLALECYREFNNRSDENYDIEIAHLEKEIAYSAQQNTEEMPSKDSVVGNLTGIWRLEMEFGSFQTKRLFILGADGKYSLHARMQTEYGPEESHFKGVWRVDDDAIVLTIEEPKVYKGQNAAKRFIRGLSDSQLLVDLVAERHVYKRIDRLSDSDKLLALTVNAIADKEIASLIIGKWSGQLSMGISEIKVVTEYQKDGTYEITGDYEGLDEAIPFEVLGTWTVNNGSIIQTILKANPNEIREDGDVSHVRVLKIEQGQFIYYDVDSGVTMSDISIPGSKTIE